MTRALGGLVRRLARGAAGCLLGGAMMVPLGPTTTSQAVNQINGMSMRPLPLVAPTPAMREGMVWVPDRVVHVPGGLGPSGTIVVPAHWERRTPEGDLYVPPLTAPVPATGGLQSFPAGSYPPPDERPYGP
jgi:hypothetical protein